ncbi:MAG: hypothetical protein IPF49_00090 [Gammaproteobacteria bacterium]|nr:hypothetical protein [Gammaproteobacteria bacterium]
MKRVSRHACSVPVDDWFRWTRAGFGFFEDYFGIAYPFLKYDQVLVPEYASGAMENVAAVVFDENLVGRGQLTATARETIANTILHEMAHMWFGNLVTMQWWNGLWLNESFANFMAFLALAEATEFRDAWHSFYASEKTWAYRDDARATTHPIEVVVADARSSFANFDGISYGKGAAILKQLYFLLGPEAFRSGVSAYLRERAWRNARLEDFVAALAQASGRNLDAWTREWLLAAGTNTVRATVQCTAGQLQSLTLLQSAPAARPQLRSQRLEVALYREGDGSPYQVIDTVVAGASTAVSIPGQIACPDFVWPNHQDWAFARLGLGPADLDFLQRNLMQFDDPLMRNMIWQTLWHMVEDGTLALPDFLQLALQFEAAEHDPRTLASIHYRIAAAFDLALRIGAAGGLPVAVPELMQQLRRDAWWEVLTAAPASDSQKIWLDHYLRIAGGDEDLDDPGRDYWARIGNARLEPRSATPLDAARLSRGRRLPRCIAAGASRARARSVVQRRACLARSTGSTTGAAPERRDARAADRRASGQYGSFARHHEPSFPALADGTATGICRSHPGCAGAARQHALGVLHGGLCAALPGTVRHRKRAAARGSPCLFRTARQTDARRTCRCARRQ